MSEFEASEEHERDVDMAPGDEFPSGRARLGSDLTGLGLAAALTAVAFALAQSHLIWGPALPVALMALAIGQMGVHLVFFLHITTAPDNTNNVLALAFGVLVVVLLVGGSVWIMDHLNHNMMMPSQMIDMQR